MGGDPLTGDCPEIGMGPRIQAVMEQILDPGAAELAWRQADAVNDQKVHGRARWTIVPIGGGRAAGPGQPSRHGLVVISGHAAVSTGSGAGSNGA